MISPIATRRTVWAVAWVVAAALVVFLAYALIKRSETPIVSLPMDRVAPDFTVTGFSGEPLSLAKLRGKPLVINFWASWCAPCRDESPLIERYWQQFRDRDVTFVGIDIQDTDPAARAFVKEFSLTYPNARDLTGEIAIDYGVVGVPETYFINRDGQIVRKYVGPLNEGALRAHLEELLN